MNVIKSFLRFWYDFIVGDAWEIAAGVVLVLAAGGVLLHLAAVPEWVLPPLVGAGVLVVVGASVLAEARRRQQAARA